MAGESVAGPASNQGAGPEGSLGGGDELRGDAAAGEYEVGEIQELVVVQGVLVLKPDGPPREGRVVRVKRRVGSHLRTTGRSWRGARGGLWVEVQKPIACKGQEGVKWDTPLSWALVQGPGFGFTEALLVEKGACVKIHVRKASDLACTVAELLLPLSCTVSQLIRLLSLKTGLSWQKIRLTKGLPEMGPNDSVGRLAVDYTRKDDILSPEQTIEQCHLDGPVTLVYLGDEREGNQKPELVEELDEASETEAEEDGPQASATFFEVVHRSVAIRSAPSTKATALGGLACGARLYGTPYKISGCPWLKIEGLEQCRKVFIEGQEEAWVLIHGLCVGLGQLLRTLTDEENAEMRAAAKEEEREGREGHKQSGAQKEKDEGENERRTAQGEQEEEAEHRKAQARKAKEEEEEAEKVRMVEEERRKAHEDALRQAEKEAARAKREYEERQAALEKANREKEEELKRLLAEMEAMRSKAPPIPQEEPCSQTGEQQEQQQQLGGEDGGAASSMASGLAQEQVAVQAEEQRTPDDRGGVPSQTSLPAGPVEDWSIEDVVQFVESLGLGHVVGNFRRLGIDGDLLLSLSEEDLRTEVDLEKLQAKKVLRRLPRRAAA